MKSLMAEPAIESGIEEGAAWGDDDDLEVDPEERKAEPGGDGEAGWDVEDADLEIPDLGPAQQAENTDSYVHLPTQGMSFNCIYLAINNNKIDLNPTNRKLYFVFQAYHLRLTGPKTLIWSPITWPLVRSNRRHVYCMIKLA